MAGYTRQSVADIVNGLPVTAPPINAEFNQVANAFHGSTGHSHDGSTGNAPPINLATSVTGYLPEAHGGNGGRNNISATTNPTITDDANDGYAAGSIWINTSDNRIFLCTDATNSAAVWQEILYSNVFDQFLPPRASIVDLGSTGLPFRNAFLSRDLDVGRNLDVGGGLTVTGATSLTGLLTAATVDLNGGNADNVVIGASTPAAVTGTVVTATDGFVGDLTGNVVGTVNGNLVGNVNGNVTGNLNGNVTTAGGTSTFNNVTITGTLDMSAGTTGTITGLAAPSAASDVATKAYVDSEISGLLGAAPAALDTLNELAAALNDDPNFASTITNQIAGKLSVTGGSLTGDLDMQGNRLEGLPAPTNASDAATKDYVDNSFFGFLPLSGGTMTGQIFTQGNHIHNDTNPTQDNHLTRKGYVDSILGSATSAATSASQALTYRNEAQSARDTAQIYRNEAETARNQAQAVYDGFDDRYLGAKASEPTTDNDGDPLQAGALFFDTTAQTLKIWGGSSWSTAAFDTSGALVGTNNLSDLDNVATARANLGLTFAAITPLQLNPTDAGSGKLLTVGAFGLGTQNPVTVSNLDATNLRTGFYKTDDTATSGTFPTGSAADGYLIVENFNNADIKQTWKSVQSDDTYTRYYRGGGWGSWVRLLTAYDLSNTSFTGDASFGGTVELGGMIEFNGNIDDETLASGFYRVQSGASGTKPTNNDGFTYNAFNMIVVRRQDGSVSNSHHIAFCGEQIFTRSVGPVNVGSWIQQARWSDFGSVIDVDGNNGTVGIGGTSSDPLTIHGDAESLAFVGTGANETGGLKFFEGNAGLDLVSRISVAGDTGNIVLDVDPQNRKNGSDFDINIDGVNQLHIGSGGNVGLGTSTPAAKIHATGTNPKIRLEGGTDIYNELQTFNGWTYFTNRVGAYNGTMVFRGQNSTGYTEWLRMSDNGVQARRWEGTVGTSGSNHVVEEGSGPNGNYTKFAGGLYIARIKLTNSDFTSGQFSWSYPGGSFTADPNVQVTINTQNTGSVPAERGAANAPGTGSCTLAIDNPLETGEELHAIAVGQWT